MLLDLNPLRLRPSLECFACSVPSSSHHSWNALFFPPLRVFPSLFIRASLSPSYLQFSSSPCTHFVESLWIEFRVLPKTSSVLPSCAASRDVEPSSLFHTCDALVLMAFPFFQLCSVSCTPHMPHPPCVSQHPCSLLTVPVSRTWMTPCFGFSFSRHLSL